MKVRLVLAAAAAIALAGCGASSSTPSTTLPAQSAPPPPSGQLTQQVSASPSVTGPQQGQVGAPLMVTSGEKAAMVTIVSAKYSTAPLGYRTPEKGGFLIIDVLWESQTGTSDVSADLFNAKDARGVQQYNTFIPSDAGIDPLRSGSVPPGDKLRGAVAFDIGPGPWTVILGLFSEAARWTITTG